MSYGVTPLVALVVIVVACRYIWLPDCGVPATDDPRDMPSQTTGLAPLVSVNATALILLSLIRKILLLPEVTAKPRIVTPPLTVSIELVVATASNQTFWKVRSTCALNVPAELSFRLNESNPLCRPRFTKSLVMSLTVDMKMQSMPPPGPLA